MVATMPEPSPPKDNPLVDLINDPYTVNAPHLSTAELNKKPAPR
jgi:hypothetical protein